MTKDDPHLNPGSRSDPAPKTIVDYVRAIFPPEIVGLYFNPPPTIRGENEVEFYALAAALEKEFRPLNQLQYAWVCERAVCLWEMRRKRTHKVGLFAYTHSQRELAA